jgi:type IV secretory pathway VirJ component
MPNDKKQPRQPVEYLVKEKSLIGNEIKEAGEKAMYDGLPAENLEPLCDEGRARYQEYLASNKERVANMINQNSVSAVGDPGAFAKALAEHQASQNEAISKAISEGIAAGIAQAMAAINAAQQSSAAEVTFTGDASTAKPADFPNTAAPSAAKGTGKGNKDDKNSLV